LVLSQHPKINCFNFEIVLSIKERRRRRKRRELKTLCWASSAKSTRRPPLNEGLAWQRGEDVTRIWFKPTTVPPDEFGLCATAVVETVFPRTPARAARPRAREAQPTSLLRQLLCGERSPRHSGDLLHLREGACRAVGRDRASADHGEQLALGYGRCWGAIRIRISRPLLRYERR
jgi:hypothetical protein